MKKIMISLVMLTFVLAGCAGQHNTVGGAAVGGIGGGIAGAHIGKGTGNIAAIIGGTLLGAGLGGYVGSYLDRMDRMDRVYLNQTFETAPTGHVVQWHNPDTHSSYRVRPVKTYQVQPTGQYCREYQKDIWVGGRMQQGYGTACRRPDGQWEIVSLN